MSEPAEFAYDGTSARIVDLATHTAPASASILDRLKSVSLDTVEAKVTTFPVPMRAGFSVAFADHLPKPRLDILRQAHTGDEDAYSKAILVAQCREILVDGEVWLAEDAMPVTFKSKVLWDMLGVADAFDAVKAFYARDPDVLRTCEAILRAAGWDLGQPLDPTRP